MIRIDEIYYNVFAASLQPRRDIGLHWFEPFGTTDIKNIVGHPVVDYFDAKKRIIFWDQEPLHQERIDSFLSKFVNETFRKPNDHYPIILVTSEYNSENVKRVCDTYRLESNYYFFHAWAALDWYRGYNRTFLGVPFAQRNPTKTFLCPNNIIGSRKHRLELLSELVDRELVATNLISFPSVCPYENKTIAELCIQHNIPMGHVDLPLVIDSKANHANNSHRIDLWSYAEQTLIQVVTETVYDGARQHLTEKTFKPIVMQQPFVLVSCQGSLEYLKKYGFKTFQGIWDESYDDADDAVRIMKIAKLLSDIHNLSHKEKVQMQKHLAPIVEHNYNWFYSQEFENLLWKELTTMIQSW